MVEDSSFQHYVLLYPRARPEGLAFWKVCIIVILCVIMFCLCVWMEFVGLTWVHKDSVAYEEHFQMCMNLTELDHADVTLCNGLMFRSSYELFFHSDIEVIVFRLWSLLDPGCVKKAQG